MGLIHYVQIVALMLVLSACSSFNSLVGDNIEYEALPVESRVNAPVSRSACAFGTKACGDVCVAGCCVDGECGLGESCVQNRCVGPMPRCSYLEVLDVDNRSCGCSSDAKWCDFQSKCIPKDACCAHTDCKFRDNECGPSNVAISTCLTDGFTICKQLRDGVIEKYSLARDYTVRLDRIRQDGSIDITVDSKSVDGIAQLEDRRVDFVSIHTEKISVLRGECKFKR